jgi:hypothetical protein
MQGLAYVVGATGAIVTEGEFFGLHPVANAMEVADPSGERSQASVDGLICVPGSWGATSWKPAVVASSYKSPTSYWTSANR